MRLVLYKVDLDRPTTATSSPFANHRAARPIRYTPRAYDTLQWCRSGRDSDGIGQIVCRLRKTHRLFLQCSCIRLIGSALLCLQCRHCSRRRCIHCVPHCGFAVHGFPIFHQVLWTLLERIAGFQVLFRGPLLPFLCRDYKCDTTTIGLRSTTTYRARLLPFDAIRREQKVNVPIFRRSRIVVVSWSNRNCDIGFSYYHNVFCSTTACNCICL